MKISRSTLPVITIVTLVALLSGAPEAMCAPFTVTDLPTDYCTYVVSGTQANSNQGGTPYNETNFYNKGAMMISALMDDQVLTTYYSPRIMQALFSFNTATVKPALDAQFGTGQWVITSVSVKMSSNYAVAGMQPNNPDFNKIAAGYFELALLGSNGWNPATVTWNTLQPFLTGTTAISAGTFYWPATSDLQNMYVTYSLNAIPELVNGIIAGEISFWGRAADDRVAYLFNTNRKGTPPALIITADTLPASVNLNVTISGTGGGSVNNLSGGFSCGSGACSTGYGYNTQLTLTGTPDAQSIFGGWSEPCRGTATACNLSMTGDRAITATFTAAPRAMIGSAPYVTIGAAYTAAAENATLQTLTGHIAENLTLNRGLNISMSGGYNATFTARTDLPTILDGVLTIETGSLTIDELIISGA